MGDVLLKKDDNIIDLIVHYKDGQYWAYIEKEGKFAKEGFDEANFAAFIKQKIPEGNDPIRLLSCSDLESAGRFSEALGNRKVIASDNSVKIYEDGTVEGGQWFEVIGTDRNSRKEINNPTPPKATTDKTKFVMMGGRLEVIYNNLGELKQSARELLENEGILISFDKGLQSSKNEKFKNIFLGKHREKETTYLWTIDDRGINIARELTPFPTPRGNIVHSNISERAYIAGEMWFETENKVIINAGSGRFGDGNNLVTEETYQAAVEFWKYLGYEVTVIPFKKR